MVADGDRPSGRERSRCVWRGATRRPFPSPHRVAHRTRRICTAGPLSCPLAAPASPPSAERLRLESETLAATIAADKAQLNRLRAEAAQWKSARRIERTQRNRRRARDRRRAAKNSTRITFANSLATYRGRARDSTRRSNFRALIAGLSPKEVAEHCYRYKSNAPAKFVQWCFTDPAMSPLFMETAVRRLQEGPFSRGTFSTFIVTNMGLNKSKVGELAKFLNPKIKACVAAPFEPKLVAVESTRARRSDTKDKSKPRRPPTRTKLIPSRDVLAKEANARAAVFQEPQLVDPDNPATGMRQPLLPVHLDTDGAEDGVSFGIDDTLNLIYEKAHPELGARVTTAEDRVRMKARLYSAAPTAPPAGTATQPPPLGSPIRAPQSATGALPPQPPCAHSPPICPSPLAPPSRQFTLDGTHGSHKLKLVVGGVVVPGLVGPPPDIPPDPHIRPG